MKNTSRQYRSQIKKALLGCILIAIIFVGIQIIVPYRFQQNQKVRYDRYGTAIIGQKQNPYTTREEVPTRLTNMLIQIEDKRFRSHPGIDPIALLRALRRNITQSGSRQGASTIDQQLIKLDNQQFDRGLRAKLKENRRAVNLQLHLTKKDIALRYINTIPFSHQIVGRKSACQSYRGKACKYLSDEQLLVTRAIAQLGANPYREQDWQKIIKKASKYSSLAFFPEETVHIETSLSSNLHAFPGLLDPRVALFLQNDTAPGVTAYSLSLDYKIDRILSETAKQRQQYQIQDCCIVVVDEEGELISMNMCSDRDDPENGKINTCTIPRQTGSAIKPFLYLYAFKKLGKKSSDTIVDEPVQFDLGGGNIYDPKNFDLQYHGEVTYAYALGNSLNIPAIKTLHQVGVGEFLDFLKQQLIQLSKGRPISTKTTEEVGLSLALGTYEMTPWQFAQLWRLLLPNQHPEGHEQQTPTIRAILSDPVQKTVSFGQDNFLSPRGRAVKTGTSRNFVDAWICGVNNTKKITACLRLGNIDNQSMLGASSEVGSYLWGLLVDAIDSK